MDFIILTTSDKDGASLRDYADDFYENGGFGTDEEHSGLVMLIDMEERTVYMSTTGKAIRYLTDQRILRLTDYNDELYDELADGDYKDAAEVCIEGVRAFVKEGIVSDQHNYDEETGAIDYYKPQKRLTFFELLISLLIPGFIAWRYTKNIKRQYAMEAEKKNNLQFARAYRALSAFAFAVNADDMIKHNVTCRPIPRPTGGSGSGSSGTSTIHHSSSGGVHGGGGGGRHF